MYVSYTWNEQEDEVVSADYYEKKHEENKNKKEAEEFTFDESNVKARRGSSLLVNILRFCLREICICILIVLTGKCSKLS